MFFPFIGIGIFSAFKRKSHAVKIENMKVEDTYKLVNG